MKNKGMWQSDALSQNSEAIGMWKVACHPPSRDVGACDNYSFQNTIVFFLLQCLVRTIIKLNLKQVSKEFYEEFQCKKIQKKLVKIIFMFVLQFYKVCRDLKRLENVFHKWNIVFSDQNCNQSDLTQYKIKYYVIFCCIFELTGWDVCFIVTLTLYLVP